MPKVTFLQPHPLSPASRLTGWLEECGIDFDVVDLQRQALPPAEDWGDGVVVLGGKMNAFDVDNNPWIAELRAQLRVAIERDLPVLAICLGHQILASTFGGEVVVGHPGGGEHGVCSVVLLRECGEDPVMKAVYCPEATQQGGEEAAILAYESHFDAVVSLPPGAVLLAGSQMYPIQAFRLGSALGVQFHPEMTPEAMTLRGVERGEDGESYLAGLRAVDATVVASARRIAHGFAAQCGGRVPQEPGDGAGLGERAGLGDARKLGEAGELGDGELHGSAALGGAGELSGRAELGDAGELREAGQPRGGSDAAGEGAGLGQAVGTVLEPVGGAARA